MISIQGNVLPPSTVIQTENYDYEKAVRLADNGIAEFEDISENVQECFNKIFEKFTAACATADEFFKETS